MKKKFSVAKHKYFDQASLSDLSLWVSLLFFLVSDIAPRLLFKANDCFMTTNVSRLEFEECPRQPAVLQQQLRSRSLRLASTR